jgi:hypothetical protein
VALTEDRDAAIKTNLKQSPLRRSMQSVNRTLRINGRALTRGFGIADI